MTMPLLTRAAAHNAPNPLAETSNTHPGPARKVQSQKGAKNSKAKTSLPTGFANTISTIVTESMAMNPTDSFHSTNLSHAVQAPPPPPPPSPPQVHQVSRTYAHKSGPLAIDHPVPHISQHDQNDLNVDPDATFISNHIKQGHNLGLHPSPVPDSPLDLDQSPGHYDNCSPPWLENEQGNEVDDTVDQGTPLYFPSSTPSSANSPSP
jgi:hypothetical protein